VPPAVIVPTLQTALLASMALLIAMIGGALLKRD
jgi:hypothetical protein